ncbi:Phosphatidylinositol 4,5-bisphosphate 3-kinase catalytic subunit gamma isoform [Phytophthora boehmeriae]|uniref:phosphatidylinositol 3-kinase n=1 Tax=Phytophthora boehmeriae TaxID=109152 RepID=A0A8T1XBW8_9STRA|nr:Phosphatidylinositol 4,5-bisphosphate 3-kinase catalytic subunit gamma isoform [Phytophthora boehmeriae]
MSDVVHLDELKLAVGDAKTASDQASAGPEEARQADVAATTPRGPEKENKWKLAFRQLMFMKRMNMQFNDRTKNEIELRQQNISPTSLICSVPYFNGFSAEDIKALVAASRRESLRPGETMLLNRGNADALQKGKFYIVSSGHLALAKAAVPRAVALKQSELYPQLRLGIGDYFCVHAASEMKVIAMELAECLVIPMKKIVELNAASGTLITTEKRDLTPEASEMESFKKWALQFSLIREKGELPTAEPGGFANCSVKTFCKDHFPNITPENELDHTLEYMKTALTSIFSARKVRIYAIDKASGNLVIKFSDEKLSKRSVDIASSTGKHILTKEGAVYIADAQELLGADVDENDVAREFLKQPSAGTLEITLECSGSWPQSFEFSSLSKKKKSIAFRASIFFNAEAGGRKSGTNEPHSLASLPVEKQKLLQRLRRDPLVEISTEDRQFIWSSRLVLMEDSALLPAYLLSVDWGNREQVLETYRLLLHWRQPTYLQALQLLSPLYSDPKVRAYAVRCMHALPDHRLQLYLLQLVQALKNERYHDSALARFLLMRALTNPAQIGYLLYWFLKAETHNYQTAERFELISSQYLQLCGSYKLEIRQSVYVMKKLEEIAGIVKGESSGTARKEKLHDALRAVVLPETFQLPLQPRSYCTKIIVESCRVMESKKRPLFLQLESAKAQHGRPYVIFKAGDDLRQDQLVLQILRVMDDLWREAGLELCLLPYACISTGDEIGMIEVVGDSETLASIIYARHAKSSTKIGRKLKAAADALVKDGVFSDWLFKNLGSPVKTRKSSDELALDAVSPNIPTADAEPSSPSKAAPSISACFPLSPRRMMARKKSTASRDQEITENFVRSCAGYCVATYVLGIGDRHNDNIMLQRSGKFFHIDFGHFLGHFKSKLGVKRERAPFVFTPSMLDTMGGKKSENYQQFQTLACDAFQVLRTNSNLLITLLVLALTCGIPELTSVNNIKWVHKTLMLELPDDEAREAFKKLINVALNTTTTKLNDAVHLMAH